VLIFAANQTPKQRRVNKQLVKVKQADMFGFDSDGEDGEFSIKQPSSLARYT